MTISPRLNSAWTSAAGLASILSAKSDSDAPRARGGWSDPSPRGSRTPPTVGPASSRTLGASAAWTCGPCAGRAAGRPNAPAAPPRPRAPPPPPPPGRPRKPPPGAPAGTAATTTGTAAVTTAATTGTVTAAGAATAMGRALSGRAERWALRRDSDAGACCPVPDAARHRDAGHHRDADRPHGTCAAGRRTRSRRGRRRVQVVADARGARAWLRAAGTSSRCHRSGGHG